MPRKFSLIYADPPWKQSKGGTKAVRPKSSGLELDYDTMPLPDIEILLNKVSDTLTTPSHCFFVWTIDKYLHETESMMIKMGYKLHARMIWNKVTGIPAAFTIRYGHEYLLWFYKGNLMPIDQDERGKIHSVFTEQVKKHSQKPQIAYEILERLYPFSGKLELFARNNRPGWNAFGNQVENSIII